MTRYRLRMPRNITMNIEPEQTALRQGISAYDDHQIVIAGHAYHHSLIAMPGMTPVRWPVKSFDTLTIDDLVALKTWRPDIVVLGTGQHTRQLPQDWIFTLLEHGLIIECMNNRAACGTCNLLLAEERKVLLALVMDEINP